MTAKIISSLAMKTLSQNKFNNTWYVKHACEYSRRLQWVEN